MSLVIFKSRASANIMMLDKHAKLILDLFGKNLQQGIITSDETASAIEKLEQEINRIKELEKQEAAEKARQKDTLNDQRENDDGEAGGDEAEENDEKKEPIEPPPVSFSARAYPFLQMLKAANRKKESIVWGV